MGKWQKFVDTARKVLNVKKTQKYEPIVLDYTKKELEILRYGGKISRTPQIKK